MRSRRSTPAFYAGTLIILTTLAFMFYHEREASHHSVFRKRLIDSEFNKDITLDGFEKHLGTVTRRNASALFNTVLNTLRKKGSDLNPNGASMIPAIIPQGTIMYNGYGREYPSNPGWVVFDGPFSYNIAPNLPEFNKTDSKNGKRSMDFGTDFTARSSDGILYTFEAAEQLSMIYLDGASASKILEGPTDTFFIISKENGSFSESSYLQHEKTSAEKACEWAKSAEVDGFVRSGAGFEAILCDISGPKIRMISNTTMANPDQIMGFPRVNSSLDSDEMQPVRKLYNDLNRAASFDHMRAAVNVYDGDARILPDFSGMVTGINRTHLDRDPYKRRLLSFSDETRNNMLKDLAEYTTGKRIDPYAGTDWRILADLVVKRFGPVLLNLNQSYTRYLKDPDQEHYKYLAHNLTLFTVTTFRQYVNFEDMARDQMFDKVPEDRRKDALRRLVYDYSRPHRKGIRSDMDKLIWSAIASVVRMIGRQIFDTSELAAKMVKGIYNSKPEAAQVSREEIEKQARKLAKLIALFGWPDFYRCKRVCAWNEVCVVPDWGPGPAGQRMKLERTRFNQAKCVSISDMGRDRWE